MARFKIGVQLHPQNTTIGELRSAWERVDAMGVDSLWTWDHFFPLYGDPEAAHFEGYSLLAAMAVTTHNTPFGMMVTCNSYRNPELLADMARTIDHLSGGRFILGIGAGWFERDYDEYGYEFGTAGQRLQALGEALPRIKDRLARLNPAPLGPMPIMIGGGGEKKTLRMVAEHAQMWNGGGTPEELRHKNDVLDRWCAEIGRDPSEIERTALVNDRADVDALLDAGITHLLYMAGPPYDLAPVERLLERRG
jgi:probable F420-dependent oxidoreductase